MTIRILILSISTASFSVCSTLDAGEKVFLGTKSPLRRVSMDEIDHALFGGLLKTYVDQNGLVDYRGIKQSRQATQQLDEYLKHLSTADLKVTASREAKLAFFINAYNAVTLKGMLREYPTSSIKNHTAAFLGYNIWHDLLLYVGGQPISLDDMEHKVLRKMNEPRIHFALVCASKGCPRLLNAAYVPERLDEQLELNTRDFFSRPRNFRHQGNRLYLSSILKWFDTDFGESRPQQLRTYSKWLPTAASRKLAKSGGAEVRFLEYDWSINEQPAQRRRVKTRDQRR